MAHVGLQYSVHIADVIFCDILHRLVSLSMFITRISLYRLWIWHAVGCCDCECYNKRKHINISKCRLQILQNYDKNML